ncbi:MAG: bifunctional DNA-formamidopyrimidine glycosylase/DNA-(apurinic or apyrimidinic site) lyase [Candidatus Caenarcaniphilales bacterium]|nr:bifunctional DNA-formamidopyrimidine glycosylase/DNA-(apurinic or apyrimidinic site) lyase [Candidatus Caenarcaniphilales bacterium]
MPELPEVETVRKGLEQKIVGKKILKVTVRRDKTIEGVTAREFEEKLQGQSFRSIQRRAKYLFLVMESGLTVIVHLKMSGNFLSHEPSVPLPVHTHVVFSLSDGKELRFKDLRAFGRMTLHNSFEEALKQGTIPKLAPEPLQEAFTLGHFKAKLKKFSSPIKPILLDQTKLVSGVGNIYADESLFLSGISPQRKASSIKPKEAESLFNAIKKVIAESIEAGGTSIRDYVQTDGSIGDYALKLFVYGRKKGNCLVCESPLSYIRLGQRGTHFCPSCQS